MGWLSGLRLLGCLGSGGVLVSCLIFSFHFNFKLELTLLDLESSKRTCVKQIKRDI